MTKEPIERTISRLESKFNRAHTPLNSQKNNKGTPLHTKEVDFMYLINEIRNIAPCDRWEKIEEVERIIESLGQ